MSESGRCGGMCPRVVPQTHLLRHHPPIVGGDDDAGRRVHHPPGMVDPILIRHGVLTAAQLRTLGWSRKEREVAIAAGHVTRVRGGWFAGPGADARVVAAVASGGCLGCASALRAHGVWVPESLGREHVRLARRADGAEAGRGCRPYGRMPPVHAAIDPIEIAFRCVLRCGNDEDVVVVADSLLHLRLATMHELERWTMQAPARTRALLPRTARAESGLESMVRIRLRRHRIRVRTQVQIEDMRVDMVVGELLVIECDGAEHHQSWAAQAADRARDLGSRRWATASSASRIARWSTTGPPSSAASSHWSERTRIARPARDEHQRDLEWNAPSKARPRSSRAARRRAPASAGALRRQRVSAARRRSR